jgi:formamidopyrimidine-DNA glycosylase
MPELPEVETVRLQLLAVLPGRTIKSVAVCHEKSIGYDARAAKKLAQKTIAHIDRAGKLLIFTFKNDDTSALLVHLKMTGQLFFADRSVLTGGGHRIGKGDLTLPGRHTRLIFRFTDGSRLYFNDMRLFGYARLATREGVERARGGFGPEPHDPLFDKKAFATALTRRRASVKAALLDQSFVAGLGNIYADEALFRARVHPARRTDTMTLKEALAVAKTAGAILKEAIAEGGTTFQHFADVGGRPGNFTRKLKVFGKQGAPCPRCSAVIEKTRVAGRGTHFCPRCQI